MLGTSYEEYCAYFDVKIKSMSDKNLIKKINKLDDDINVLTEQEVVFQNEYIRRFGKPYSSSIDAEMDKVKRRTCS